MWSSVLVPLPMEAENRPVASQEADGGAPPEGAVASPVDTGQEQSPVRASGWRRWLGGWGSRSGEEPGRE
ncbi:hypothetical protein [Caldimonas tepidiphila]|uniref:hypothetical protein n=1 Tax=Caldimonas tepidiphila TaxID=2315841 RepID=UPI00130098A2|nr:hypothetical protein [Caldimonas tepidiphila]